MCLLIFAFCLPLGLLVRDLAAEHAIEDATTEMNAVAALVAAERRGALELVIAEVNSKFGAGVTVFMPEGEVLGIPAPRSPAVELALRGRSVVAAAPGGREIVISVQRLRSGPAVIRTFISDAALREGVFLSWAILAGLGLVLLAVGLLLADRLARSITTPVADLAGAARRLSGGDLSARAEPAGPKEIKDVGLALNQLAERIQVLLDNERERIADLSHRLRTPLTVLRLDADSLTDHGERRLITEGVDGVERAVTQTIKDARRATTEEAPTCDAVAVVGERVAFWSALAEDQHRRVITELGEGPLEVRTSEADLADLVDALLGNVFAHTQEGAGFGVSLQPDLGGAVLLVSDEGPGIAAEPARGHSTAGSTGLGLSIVRRIAEASGGSLELTGSTVVVRLGG